VLLDDPLLTPRIAFRHRPLVRAVFDRRLRTPPSARLLSTLDSGPVIIVTAAGESPGLAERAARLATAGATVAVIPETDLTFEAAALAVLLEAGASSVVLEGGPAVQRAFWDRGLVDRVQMYVTPRVIGTGGVPWWTRPDVLIPSLKDVRSTPLGADVLIEGDVHRTD
jgi:diaminohydroxyphosphoribosylaminopyrimidine deaminase/5-amino-6-(5-phosphoribosylamino)uracil reductase